MIPERYDHRVQISLNPIDVNDTDIRIIEIQELKAWIDDLVEWQPDQYAMNIHSSASKIDIWFKEDRHAMVCALRWL